MEKKPWYTSVTLWSAVITAAGVFAPKYAPAIGGIATDAATILGLVGTVIGRLRATQEVTFTAPKSE